VKASRPKARVAQPRAMSAPKARALPQRMSAAERGLIREWRDEKDFSYRDTWDRAVVDEVPMQKQVVTVIPQKKAISRLVTRDGADAWYNVYHSMYSEMVLPLPRLPTPGGVMARCAGAEGSYKNTFVLQPACTGVVLFNPHAGEIYPPSSVHLPTILGWDFLFLQTSTSTPILGTEEYTYQFGELTGDFLQPTGLWDASPIQPVGGYQPRSLLQPSSPNGASVLLGASDAVEVVTPLNGSAQIWAADMNQNPRFWSNCSIVSNTFTPGTYDGVNAQADPQQLWPTNCTGKTRIIVPADPQYYGMGGGGATFNMDPVTQCKSMRTTSLGGNSRAYAYAQIPGDIDWMPGRGIATPFTTDTSGNLVYYDSFHANGEFPLGNLYAMLFSAKAYLVVQNTSSVPITVNVTCTADFGAIMDATVPEYPSGVVPEPHDVPDMDFLATADVGESAVDAYFKVKRRMVDALDFYDTDEATIIQRVAKGGGVPRAPVVAGSHVERPPANSSDFLGTVTKVMDTVVPLAQ